MDIKFRVIEKVTQSTTFCNLKDDFKQLLPLISQKSEIINLQPYGKIRCGQVITNDRRIQT